MVYLPPPHLASASRPSYGEAYASILASYRRSPPTSAASVILLVAPDVDALSAAHMLGELLKQDDVMFRIIPVSGLTDLEKQRDLVISSPGLHTLFMLNMGAIMDLPSPEWFGDCGEELTVHVIDSSRPQNLSSLFGGGHSSERVVIWDDGGADKMQDEKKAWEVLTYEPELDSDEDSDIEDREEDDEADEYEEGSPSTKRRATAEGDRSPKKRQRLDRPQRTSREERDRLGAVLEKYYMSGTWYEQSASGTIYLLATVLERVDAEMLWLAILGLTYQYTSSRISRAAYEKYCNIYGDEVARLHPPPPTSATKDQDYKAQHPDDRAIFATNELRFMLLRHWNLYDAMFHSSYVASKLGIWKEKGRKRLTGLLAKMGFGVTETQQPYSHLAKDLKLALRAKLDQIAPEYGMLELTYPSFARSCGYLAYPLSAGDAVEVLGALLNLGRADVEVEVEGARGGGEWFGGGRVWAASELEGRRGEGKNAGTNAPSENGAVEKDHEDEMEEIKERWVPDFWLAYDALTDISNMLNALPLAMRLHRAVVACGTSIIDKQDMKRFRGHTVVILTQGPHLAMFSRPAALSRLALWLVEALRENTASQRRRKSLPVVVACLNEQTNTYLIVGVMAAMDFEEVRKNEFGLAFLDAKERCNAHTRHGTFETSVIEIAKDDLRVFIETLCEGVNA